MSEFTKEQLAELLRAYRITRDSAPEKCPESVFDVISLAAFLLAQMEQLEADQERELIERWKDINTLTCALESERLRAANAEAERDRLRADLADALDLQAGHGPTALASVVTERDRLKVELDSVLLHADRVMFLLDEHGASILPHLMDDDENPGEMLRQAVRRARERAK